MGLHETVGRTFRGCVRVSRPAASQEGLSGAVLGKPHLGHLGLTYLTRLSGGVS